MWNVESGVCKFTLAQHASSVRVSLSVKIISKRSARYWTYIFDGQCSMLCYVDAFPPRGITSSHFQCGLLRPLELNFPILNLFHCGSLRRSRLALWRWKLPKILASVSFSWFYTLQRKYWQGRNCPVANMSSILHFVHIIIDVYRMWFDIEAPVQYKDVCRFG